MTAHLPTPNGIATPLTTSDGAYTVTLETSGWTYAARADETLLQAGLRAGIRLASSCRNGTCRACMCHLESGAITYVVERPGLSRDEIEEGWILPCVAQARTDVRLAGDNAERVVEATARPLPVGPRR
ncbi:2Fe-2S iron-sulfur cluster-binding protein [Bordetella sp. LUAb4]|uniref:2Fe-2S iron-sulfur cluster-binding protein n=1 Tax=Bordetella sp. LUAb4 TaxID=2843195 RepID=UPI001E2B93A1|nr:2Fe-2S iron-sulfur cluster-binding protein [Bordetella sp. LUAb4]